MINALFTEERRHFHRQMLETETLTRSSLPVEKAKKYKTENIVSNADSGQQFSIDVSNNLAEKLEKGTGTTLRFVNKKKAGQTLGNLFEDCCTDFLERTFKKLDHLRPGHWVIEKLGSRRQGILGKYEQYSHLYELNKLAEENSQLKSFLGDGYTVAPDIIIARLPESDDEINSSDILVDKNSCLASKLRASNHTDENHPEPLIHASISCKFTMRSDRAQNTRTEALNLIRARKGRTPHIVSLTAEPIPSRIASLALGTGDMDCVYHVALYELRDAINELDYPDASQLLETMISGKRLKDISDLPLDLCI